MAKQKEAPKKTNTAAQKCLAVTLLGYSQLVLFAFWGMLVVGYFYYGFIGEADWDCYATQDGDVMAPWQPSLGQTEVPDDYHHVNANF